MHVYIFGYHLVFAKRTKDGIEKIGYWCYVKNFIGIKVILTPFFGLSIFK